MSSKAKHSEFYKDRHRMYNLRDDMFLLAKSANAHCRAAIKLAEHDPFEAAQMAEDAAADYRLLNRLKDEYETLRTSVRRYEIDNFVGCDDTMNMDDV